MTSASPQRIMCRNHDALAFGNPSTAFDLRSDNVAVIRTLAGRSLRGLSSGVSPVIRYGILTSLVSCGHTSTRRTRQKEPLRRQNTLSQHQKSWSWTYAQSRLTLILGFSRSRHRLLTVDFVHASTFNRVTQYTCSTLKQHFPKNI